MSTSHDEHAADAHDDGAHAHDEPPPPPEPETPVWVTLLGIGLFATAGIAFLFWRGGAPSSVPTTRPSLEEHPTVQARPIAPPPPATTPIQLPRALPVGSGMPMVRTAPSPAPPSTGQPAH